MRAIVIAAVLLLAACSVGPSRRDYLNTLVGQPEAEAIRQLGVPSRAYESGGHKYLAFLDQRRDYIPGSPFFFGGGFYGPGYGFGGVFPPEVIDRVCETTLDVVGGRVAGWTLRGNACG